LSTNAGGVNVLRYGTAREQVLGLEVVLPDGRIWNALRGLRKDNTGYDLKQLFLGAEGTLGIITAAVLRLHPKPSASATAWITLASAAAAMELLAFLHERLGERLSAFELLSRNCVEAVLTFAPGTQDPLARPHPWYVLVEIADSGEEQALPERLVAERAAVNRIVYDTIAELGGSISAEHGLGQLKRDEIRAHKSPLELELMRRLKQALDPQGLMNPGKVL